MGPILTVPLACLSLGRAAARRRAAARPVFFRRPTKQPNRPRHIWTNTVHRRRQDDWDQYGLPVAAADLCQWRETLMMEKKIAPEGVGAAYLRVSGDKQDKRSQEEAIQRWLSQHDLVVAHYYHDVGPRDMSHARQDFQRLLKDAAAGLFSWVVVAEADRLGARSPWEFGKHICLLQEAGVELWSVVDGLLSGDDVVSSILGTISSAQPRGAEK